MRVQVAYGEVDPEQVLACGRCHGTRETETVFGSGQLEKCPRCEGSGKDPRPHTYAYEVDDPVVGMHVICPPSWVPGSEASVGTVVALTSDYDGPVKRAAALT